MNIMKNWQRGNYTPVHMDIHTVYQPIYQKYC